MPPTAMYAQPQPSVNNRQGQDYNLLEGNRISALNPTAASWTNTFAPPETLGSWGRGYRSNPQHNSPNNTANWWERNSTRDCGKIVKEWGIRFTGEGGMSVEEFLQRTRERKTMAHMSDEDFLNATTEVTEGAALQWTRLRRPKWKTFDDFAPSVRIIFGPDDDFQYSIVREIYQRTQGRDEPSSTYVYKLLTMLGRLQVTWTTEKQLEVIYLNMRPKIRRLVPKDAFQTVDDSLAMMKRAQLGTLNSLLKKTWMPFLNRLNNTAQH